MAGSVYSWLRGLKPLMDCLQLMVQMKSQEQTYLDMLLAQLLVLFRRPFGSMKSRHDQPEPKRTRCIQHINLKEWQQGNHHTTSAYRWVPIYLK